jgi:hypothetical protein
MIVENHFLGFMVADLAYRPMLERLDQAIDLRSSYRVEVSVGGNVVYGRDVTPATHVSPFAIDTVFSIADRRVRITLDPRPELLQRTRRFLPELALGAGIGISLLLALSVSLAGAAFAR